MLHLAQNEALKKFNGASMNLCKPSHTVNGESLLHLHNNFLKHYYFTRLCRKSESSCRAELNPWANKQFFRGRMTVILPLSPIYIYVQSYLLRSPTSHPGPVPLGSTARILIERRERDFIWEITAAIIKFFQALMLKKKKVPNLRMVLGIQL